MFPIQIAQFCGYLSKGFGPPFSIQIIQFCGNLSKVIGQTFQSPSFLKEVGGNFECDVSVKYEG